MGISNPNAVSEEHLNATDGSVSLDGSTQHIRSGAVVSRQIAGEMLAVPIRKGVGDLDSVYTFNELGARLWLMLEQGRTTEELADWVRTNYQVTAEQAFADVARFVCELREERLVRMA